MFPISTLFLSSWKHKDSYHYFFFVFHPLLWIPLHHFPIHYILAPHWVNKFFWHLLPLPSLAIPPARMVPINITCQGCAWRVGVWQLPNPAGSLLPSVPTQWPEQPLLSLLQAWAANNNRLRDRCFQFPTILHGPLEMDSTLVFFLKTLMLTFQGTLVTKR